MKRTILTVIGVVGILAGTAQASNNLNFQGMEANYSGGGVLEIGEVVADYMYTLVIKRPTPTNIADGSLTIKPKTATARNRVFINSIICDGSLNSLHIQFPPGQTMPCYLRNLAVNGELGTVTIDGGDLGAPDAQDGRVVVKGNINSIAVNGRKYKVPNTTFTEWWGGNIWADITAGGSIKKISTKGGSMYYDANNGILGTIKMGNNLDTLQADGVKLKTNSIDTLSEIFVGGCINANVLGTPVSVVKQITSKGGSITDGRIDCLQVQRITVTGQKIGDPMFIPTASQGVSKVYLRAADQSGDGNYSDLKNVTIKNGTIRDSMFVCKGDIGTVSITGDTGDGGGLISNVVMRAGFVGDLSVSNIPPSIYPANVSTAVFGGNPIVVPFRVNAQPGEETTIRLHYRDRAITGLISNQLGETFSGTNRWRTMESVVTGFFVWATSSNFVGISSNVTVRARDNGIPNKYSDLTIVINVTTSVLPVTLLVDPPDSPRTNAAGNNTIVWTLNVQDPLNQGVITYGVSGMSAFQLGITVTNAMGATYASTSMRPLPAGSYTDIVFSADNGVFTDRKTIMLVLTNAAKSASGPSASEQIADLHASRAVPVIPAQPASTIVPELEEEKGWEGSYLGDISKVSTVGSILFSRFIASADDNPNEDWVNAIYFSPLKSLKVDGTAMSNTFVSLKKISISKADLFDFTNNFIWIQGTRAMDKTQK